MRKLITLTLLFGDEVAFACVALWRHWHHG
jgi:hypothetical protein